MKTKVKKFVLLLGVVIIAISGAFANSISRQDKTALMDRIGFLNLNGNCFPTSIVCSVDFSPYICTDGINMLYDWNGTACPLVLYRKMD
jgi:hypothetical protein